MVCRDVLPGSRINVSVVCRDVLPRCRINVLGSAGVCCRCAGSCLRVCCGVLPGCRANASGSAGKVPGTVGDMWESPVWGRGSGPAHSQCYGTEIFFISFHALVILWHKFWHKLDAIPGRELLFRPALSRLGRCASNDRSEIGPKWRHLGNAHRGGSPTPLTYIHDSIVSVKIKIKKINN